MPEDELSDRLQAVDRWALRRKRLFKLFREEGIGGLVERASKAGIGGTIGFLGRQIRYQICSLMGAQWDRKYGVDTAGQIDLVDIDVIGPNKADGYASVATSPRAFAFLSAFFPDDKKQFTFVDVGCGKGRVLMLAGLQGFDRVIGVEFAPLLCEVAKKNLDGFSGRRPAEWSVVNADAATIDLPLDGPLLIYSFNPFNAEVWRQFVPVLLRARKIGKHPLRLILSGTLPESLRAAAAVVQESAGFQQRAQGVTPFFLDAYAPYYFWVFDAL
jgi:SAM-dependent methyltransferase